MKQALFSFTSAFLLLAVYPGRAQIVNGDFESGLTGWTCKVPDDSGYWFSFSSGHYQVVPAPITSTALGDLLNASARPPTSILADPMGNRYASLSAPESGIWFPDIFVYTAPDGTEYQWHPLNPCAVTLSQTFSAGAGSILSGWVQFQTSDPPPWNVDHTWVQVTGNGLNQQIWFMDPVTVRTNVNWTSPWLKWEWVVPSDSVYTLTLGEVNDDQMTSWSRFDNITLIPEPSSIMLAFLGTAAFILRRLRVGVRSGIHLHRGGRESLVIGGGSRREFEGVWKRLENPGKGWKILESLEKCGTGPWSVAPKDHGLRI